MNDYGDLIGLEAVCFERLLPGPITNVWAHLTESDKRAKWLAAGETELHVDGRVELHFHNAELSKLPEISPPDKYKDMPEHVSFCGKVTRCDPPRLLSHTWEFGDGFSEVTYELTPQDDQVLLRLTHQKLDTTDELVSVCGGWHTHLDILRDILNGKEAQPFWTRHMPLEAEYAKRLGIS